MRRPPTRREAGLLLVAFAIVAATLVAVFPDVVMPMAADIGRAPLAVACPLGLCVGLVVWIALIAAGRVRGYQADQRHAGNSRIGDGRCPKCGYDLRASRGRCPECGWWPNPPHLVGRR